MISHAPYHFHLKRFSRKKGQSAVAASSYRCGKPLYCEREGLTHYPMRNPKDIVASKMHNWSGTRGELWSAVELAEKKCNSQVARELELGLPADISHAARVKLCEDMAEILCAKFQVAVDWNIHRPPKIEKKNWHCHMMFSTRRVKNDVLGEKTRELDVPKTSSKIVKELREKWASLCNEAYEKAGLETRVTHLSLRAQGIARVPQRHKGAAVCALEERGVKTEALERIEMWNEVLQAELDASVLLPVEQPSPGLPPKEKNSSEKEKSDVISQEESPSKEKEVEERKHHQQHQNYLSQQQSSEDQSLQLKHHQQYLDFQSQQLVKNDADQELTHHQQYLEYQKSRSVQASKDAAPHQAHYQQYLTWKKFINERDAKSRELARAYAEIEEEAKRADELKRTADSEVERADNLERAAERKTRPQIERRIERVREKTARTTGISRGEEAEADCPNRETEASLGRAARLKRGAFSIYRKLQGFLAAVRERIDQLKQKILRIESQKKEQEQEQALSEENAFKEERILLKSQLDEAEKQLEQRLQEFVQAKRKRVNAENDVGSPPEKGIFSIFSFAYRTELAGYEQRVQEAREARAAQDSAVQEHSRAQKAVEEARLIWQGYCRRRDNREYQQQAESNHNKQVKRLTRPSIRKAPKSGQGQEPGNGISM